MNFQEKSPFALNVTQVLSVSTSFKDSPQVTTQMLLQIQLQNYLLFTFKFDLFELY